MAEKVVWVNVGNGVYPEFQLGRIMQCGDCGAICTVSTRQQHENFHKIYSHRRNASMSNVLWCDPGNHAFKAGAAGSIHFQGSQIDDDGKTVTVDTDACAEHNPHAPKATRENAERMRLTAEAEQELNDNA
jgi:hypothetical protein